MLHRLSSSTWYQSLFFKHSYSEICAQIMPPKSASAAAVIAPVTVSPPSSADPADTANAGNKRSGAPAVESSPKKFIRNIVNISIADWMARCPDGSPSGSTGTGNTYAVLLDTSPCQTVVTKKDQRKVAKKTIVIGDHTGKKAELTIWGNFAARSWTFPEGSVLLFKNLAFSSYYKDELQLKFADPDSAHELLITKAPDSLEVTKLLKTWFVVCSVWLYRSISDQLSGTAPAVFARRYLLTKFLRSPETTW